MQEQEAASAGAEEEKRAKEKRKQHRRHHHKRSNRPASAQKITSSPKKSKTAHSPSPPVREKADRMETSPPLPAPAQAGKADHSKKSSRCSTASKSVNEQQSGSRPTSTSFHSSNKPPAKGSCHNSITTTAEQSRACSSNGEVVSGTETIIVSRCSKCRSVISSTSHVQEQSRSTSRSSVGGGRASSKSATSVRSGSTRVSSTLASERGLEKRAELKAEAVRKDLHQ